MVDRDERDQDEEKKLHHAPDPDASGPKEPFTKELHLLPP
jgi:hypothetical protein